MRACWLKWVGRDWSISADYIWLNYSGANIVVTAGPLLGHEGLIKTINRRKSTAYLELDLCGRRVTTRVGLAVLSAEQRVMRNLKKAIA